MEVLKKLEDEQRVLSWMQQRGLSSNHHDSDRFLSDFLLFMAKPCGTLNMEEKCRLISEHLPKISSQVLEGTQLYYSREEEPEEYYAQHSTEQCLRFESDLCLLRGGLAVIRLDAMQRANSTLEDFCRSYFMFHGMDVSNLQSVFRFLPVLSFTESFIYQLDSLNEKVLNLSAERISIDGTSKMGMPESNQSLADVFKANPFKPLIHVLECCQLLTERIRAELKCGEEYWTLERKLCHALKSQKEILIEDVMSAIHLKSFDYRVLNLLLYKLRGEQVNDTHMEFLSVSEFLVEISDDLFDYEDDVLDNNFNILRMFVRIYGASMAPVMLANCITEAEEKYVHLLKSLDPDLSLKYRKRCEEATREGGNITGNPLGKWTIPPVIADEESYRS